MNLEDLIGGKIIEAGLSEGDPEEQHPDVDLWPAMLVEMPDGTLIGVSASRDDEGNGPGVMFVEQITIESLKVA